MNAIENYPIGILGEKWGEPESVTHIALADEYQELIGEPLAQFGVVNYAARQLGLCMGITDAPYVTSTEVYPDSLLVNDENCILAQVAIGSE